MLCRHPGADQGKQSVPGTEMIVFLLMSPWKIPWSFSAVPQASCLPGGFGLWGPQVPPNTRGVPTLRVTLPRGKVALLDTEDIRLRSCCIFSPISL